MEKKVTYGSLLKYGLLLGLMSMVFSLIKIYLRNFTDKDLWSVFMLLETATVVFFVYCAIRFAAKQIYATNYSFAKGVKVALFVGFIAAVLASIYQYVEMRYIIPEVYQAQIEIAIESAIDKGLPAGRESTIQTMFWVFGAIFAFFISFLTSLLASFFIAPFFKKRQIINSEESSSLDNQ